MRCPDCGHSLEKNSRPEVCDQCGADVRKAVNETPPQVPPPPPSGGQAPPSFQRAPQARASSPPVAGTPSAGPRFEPPPPPPPPPSKPATPEGVRVRAPRFTKPAGTPPPVEPATDREPPSAPAGPPSAPAPPPPSSRPPETEADEEYRELVAEVDKHLDQGYQLFGFVGQSASGKTHCLKALHYLLEKHGVGSQDAREKFRLEPVPLPSGATVFDYACIGPNGEKWIFVDAGGELYYSLRENDWQAYRRSTTALTHRLHHCQGLFMFLHLDRGHFVKSTIDRDLTRFELRSTETEDRVEKFKRDQDRAREKQREIEFFHHFLLFLRALKHENGDVHKVIETCKRGATLERALRDYHTRAPLLDIPVMFYFSKADTYDEQATEIADGLHLAPRQTWISTAAFVARHLPLLFTGLLSQVRRFKFDFLQSYEEHLTDSRDGEGNPIKATDWTAPDDQSTLLSVGLLSGLEFILRNQQDGGQWWRGPGIDTRQALRLHRLLHRDEWKDVRVDLGSWLDRVGSGS